jgi:hypothetical protein
VDSRAEPAPARVAQGPSGFLPERIVHLHPTRLCNLACLHCYSTSDPGRRGGLDPDDLIAALGVLGAEGYAVLSLSGGEPLVYKPLRNIVEGARELGFRVTMISNGLLAERAIDLLSRLDAMAISFDGLAERHDAMRGRDGAFAKASAALNRLASLGLPVGAAVSLTREGVAELPDLVDHLVALGARSIQIRPVARAGRAKTLDDGAFLTDVDHARLYLVVLALREELPEDVRLHCDLAPAQGLWGQRDAYVGLLGECGGVPHEERRLADLVNPLVVTDTGALKPIAYDFHPHFDIAAVAGLSAIALRRYKRERLPRLQDVVGSALAGLRERHDLVDWFDHCTRLSERAEELALASAGR